MKYNHICGVPNFESIELYEKKTKYCICIPVINEGERIINELKRAHKSNIPQLADIIICDGGSSDQSMELERLSALHVNTLLIKEGDGRQGAQLRMGFWWAFQRGYEGIITIDGNDKDSIEDIPRFIEQLENGYDFIQGSRFMKGGAAIRTPLIRRISILLIHAPVISLTAGHRFTDTTNAFRAYSKKYLLHPQVQPFRDKFISYELLAYLSVRASQLKLRVCEIPVTRVYPAKGCVPTKISFFRGNVELMKILICNLFGMYNPE